MFAFQYDLDLNMRPVQETLSIDIPQLQAIKEAVVLPGVGCGLLFAKYHDGTETVLCRFTMSRLKEAGEFCKIINHYIKTQANPEIDKKEETICPKCNRPLIENVSTCLFCFNKTSLLRKFFGMMRPHAKAFWGAETLLLIGSLLWLLHPMVIGAIIDKHLKPMQGPALYVVLLAVAMLATRVLGEGFYVVSARIMNRVGVGFSMGLRNMTFDKLQRLSMRSASKHTPGDLQRRVMEDTFNIQGFIVDSGRWAIDQVITFIVVFILLMITNWKLTLLVFVPVPLVALALARFWGFINLRYERQWRKSSRASSVLHDIIQGIRTVKSFGKEDREIAKFARVSRELADVSENNEKLWAVLFPILMFITGIGEFLVLYFGGKSVLGGVA
ncbi:MAG: ABC transporter transmembrane domain-containing protein, partial [Clostridia bacterium]|nr:ABC transporter transmembrane domain-containing protein [Clostridia bacterium]